MKLWEASLNKQSPRYADWLHILGTDRVTLLSPKTAKTQLGEEACEVYLLDWQDMDEEQSRRLLDFLAKKFGVEASAIEKDLDATGHFPIREADVTIFYSMRAFL